MKLVIEGPLCVAVETMRNAGTAPSSGGGEPGLRRRHGGRVHLAEADEREMPQRRDGAALDQPNALLALGPAHVALPGEFRPPAELAGGRCEPALDAAPKPRFGADAAENDDLAAGLDHAREIAEGGVASGGRGENILRHHDIE